MVINAGNLKSGLHDEIREKMHDIKAACGNHILKVIVETYLLTEEAKNHNVPSRNKGRRLLYQDFNRFFKIRCSL